MTVPYQSRFVVSKSLQYALAVQTDLYLPVFFRFEGSQVDALQNVCLFGLRDREIAPEEEDGASSPLPLVHSCSVDRLTLNFLSEVDALSVCVLC